VLGFSDVLSSSKFEKMLQQGSSGICKRLLETFLVNNNGCINLDICIPSGLYVTLFSFLLFQTENHYIRIMKEKLYTFAHIFI